MRLSKIEVFGLFNEYDYEIQLCDSYVTYIHSQNGMGKSTVLKLVCSVLKGNLEFVRTTNFERMDLTFDDGSFLFVENRNQELNVQISRNNVEEEIGINELQSLLRCVYIGPERAYIYDSENHLVPSLMIYMNELSQNIRKAKADTVLHDVEDDGKERTDAELDQWFRDLEAKLSYIDQAGFYPEIPSGYRFPPSRYEISQYREDYRRLALQLQKYCDEYYRFAENIVVFKDIINTVYINKTVTLNDAGFFEAKMDRSGTVVPLSVFSSGEKQMLIIFYILLFRTEPGSLVVIDEPEVSLHVSWQQQMGKFLSDVSRLRDLRMLVTTHSPSVIHDDWDHAVELINGRE
ncbi:putative ATP-binding protein involved in virulence [Thermoplasmatales archaeon BRNA1]|nr:putative ATP-binding protein involved in virulence [Thermoplasmatales archaeon BRNA1]